MKTSVLRNHKSVAFVGDGFKYSYEDFLLFVRALSGKLPGGFKKAAIFAENSPAWIVSFFSVWAKGACAIPMDAKSSVSELAYMLDDSFPEVIFTDSEHIKTAQEAVKLLKCPAPKIVNMDEACSAEILDVERKNPLGDFEVFMDSDTLSLIVYTSGTTGNPKGVMLSYKNLKSNIESVVEEGYFYEGMSVLMMLPFHHILPLMGTVVAPVFVGGKMVFPKSLSPADISAVMCQNPVDIVISVPRFYELICANIKEKINRSKILKGLFLLSKAVGSIKFSRFIFGAIHKRFGGKVKYWVCGGAALQKEVWSDMKALGFNICVGYGMSECAPIITFPRIGNVKIGSSGQPISCMEVRIIDGEIAVRGDNVTQGYFGKPEETALSIRNGWLYTGDLGYFDDDNFLFITGRRKEIIVLPNGKNLDPFEMECQIADQMPQAVLEVGVTMYEDILQAIICLKPEFVEGKSREDIDAFIRDKIILPYNRSAATYKRIIRFVYSPKELPRTRVGKLKRFHLASYLESVRDDAALESAPLKPEPDTDIYRELKSLISGQVSMPVSPDAHLEMDLGLDSLGKISLQCHIKENYGVEIPESEFAKYATLRDLSEYVVQRRESFEPSGKAITWTEIIGKRAAEKLPKTNFFHFLSIIIFRGFARAWYNIEVAGFENVPKEGAFILAPNHQSYFDGVFCVYPFSKTKLYGTYFFAKIRNIIKSGLLRYYARHSNVVIMDINGNVRESLQTLASIISKGNCVVIFPEGTRTRDGEIGEFKQAFSILSKELSCPVVPVLISGAYEGLKSRASLPARGTKIKVEYFPPMMPNPDEDYDSFSLRVRSLLVSALEKTRKHN